MSGGGVAFSANEEEDVQLRGGTSLHLIMIELDHVGSPSVLLEGSPCLTQYGI